MHESRFALFGMTPAEIAAPGAVAEAQEIVRQAPGRAIVPWGGGTRQHIGYPPERYDLALSTENLAAITDYQPADLTVTAQGGVPLARLQAALAENGQWLPLEVASPERQTVGGLVATRPDSLSRFAWGSVRDSLIGVSVVNAGGEMVRGGGKVVKNVSGYDLPKLYCGSWGTLGLIVEATFKVAPLPESSATFVVPVEAERNSEDILDTLLGAELQPSLVFLLNGAATGDILENGAAGPSLIVGFDGPSETVAWQVETLGAGEGVLSAALAGDVRRRLRDYAAHPAPMTAAFHILSSQVGAYSRMMEWTARRAGFEARVMADAAVGMVRAHFSPIRPDSDWSVFFADLADKAARVGGSFVIERMPDVLRARDTPVWLPLLSDFPLMARLKEMLDPQRMWNPGRFIGKL